MTQKGSPKIGDIYNLQDVTDVVVAKIAASVNLTNGSLVYQDGALGVKVVPTSSQPVASRIRALLVGFNNASGALGARNVETFKKGAKVVLQCDGIINPGEPVRASTTTAGRVLSEGVTPTKITTIGYYLGHVGEVEGTDNDPTASADGDLVVIQME